MSGGLSSVHGMLVGRLKEVQLIPNTPLKILNKNSHEPIHTPGEVGRVSHEGEVVPGFHASLFRIIILLIDSSTFFAQKW